jgi:hypothetical protein
MRPFLAALLLTFTLAGSARAQADEAEKKSAPTPVLQWAVAAVAAAVVLLVVCLPSRKS